MCHSQRGLSGQKYLLQKYSLISKVVPWLACDPQKSLNMLAHGNSCDLIRNIIFIKQPSGKLEILQSLLRDMVVGKIWGWVKKIFFKCFAFSCKKCRSFAKILVFPRRTFAFPRKDICVPSVWTNSSGLLYNLQWLQLIGEWHLIIIQSDQMIRLILITL